jgi:hypothetical protein
VSLPSTGNGRELAPDIADAWHRGHCRLSRGAYRLHSLLENARVLTVLLGIPGPRAESSIRFRTERGGKMRMPPD